METKRRSFLKAGVLGALALAAGGGIYRMANPPAPGRFVLDGEARSALGRSCRPCWPAPCQPRQPSARPRSTRRSRACIPPFRTCPLGVQKEVQDLFGLLALAPARRLLTGVSGGWANAGEAEVTAFLRDWRMHRFALLRTAYGALHDLALGAWYAQPAHWEAIGYPGPMKELS
ncbi:hypothetical protein G4G28_08890 [Massilia sp. Dwa41.01b]|uniref:hypothetical protein n=1 Tax=Massilia sp. Dwa41.01b TaxID=2709302 RepID=UPI00160434B9|nr:hypothetical protein [Massilia sp. Dwa41.01b]QNA88578.1 hypothetical protein G4G28_08890 [Massilia sp. Dwa41.01b]